jgi:hypothetical protein
MDYAIRFESEAFDYRGPVREDANAGNRFYGADVADFLKSFLEAKNYRASVSDEDWGWLVSVARGEQNHDVCLNNGLDGSTSSSEGPGTNGWSIYVITYATRKVLGVSLGRKRIDPDREFCALVESAIATKASRMVSAGVE